MGMLEKIEKLRDEAWEAAMASPAFATLLALDEAVDAAGGKRLLASKGEPAPLTTFAQGSVKPAIAFYNAAATPNQRLSQGDAAALALKANGPLPVGRLMESAMARGAVIGGGKPLISFRSTLSKDPRFYSLKRNGMFFWWLTDVELPEGWTGPSESYDLPLDPNPDSSQKGGDSHAATTAN